MSSNSKPPGTVPPEQLTAYERWEMPLMEEGHQPKETAIAQSSSPQKPRSEPRKHVLPPTASELESIREAAYKEGLDQGRHDGLKSGREAGLLQGLDEGKKKGFAEGQKKGQEQAFKNQNENISRHIQQLDSVVKAMTKPFDQQQQAVEEALLNLVTAVARAVTFKELSVPSSQILAVIRGAIDSLPETEASIKISLHPDDLAFVQAQPASVEKNWKLLGDPKLSIGGCRVETSQSLVDFTREKRFQSVIDQLMARQADEEAAAANQLEKEKALELAKAAEELAIKEKEALELAQAAEELALKEKEALKLAAKAAEELAMKEKEALELAQAAEALAAKEKETLESAKVAADLESKEKESLELPKAVKESVATSNKPEGPSKEDLNDKPG